MTTTSVDTSARPQRKPGGPAAIPQAASMLLRLELVSQLVMIAAAASLYGHRLTCTNKPRLTNYSCRIRQPRYEAPAGVPVRLMLSERRSSMAFAVESGATPAVRSSRTRVAKPDRAASAAVACTQ